MKIKLNYKKAIVALVLLLAMAIFVWTQVIASSEDNLSMYFLSVGQGDATYIRTPGIHDVIIDGGPDNSVLEKLGRYMPFYDKKIELMILTHPHEDHIGGLVDIINRYEVEHIVYSGINYDSAVYEIWNDLLEQENIDLNIAQAGQKISLGDVEIDIKFPSSNMNGMTIENINNSSIVSKIVFGSTSALIMGDAEFEVEDELIKMYPGEDLRSNILKAGHHGSKTSNSENFVNTINPSFGIISVGIKNRYNHPHKNTIDIFNKKDIEILRTDVNGDIKCVSQGNNFTCGGI